MNRPLSHTLERSGAAVHEYWPGTVYREPPIQAVVVVSPSASMTRAIDDAVIVAEGLRIPLKVRVFDLCSFLANKEVMRSLVLPKKVSRLQVITRQRGKGTFLPYD